MAEPCDTHFYFTRAHGITRHRVNAAWRETHSTHNSERGQANRANLNAIKTQCCPLAHRELIKLSFGSIKLEESATVDVLMVRIRIIIVWTIHVFCGKTQISAKVYGSGAKIIHCSRYHPFHQPFSQPAHGLVKCVQDFQCPWATVLCAGYVILLIG